MSWKTPFKTDSERIAAAGKLLADALNNTKGKKSPTYTDIAAACGYAPENRPSAARLINKMRLAKLLVVPARKQRAVKFTEKGAKIYGCNYWVEPKTRWTEKASRLIDTQPSPVIDTRPEPRSEGGFTGTMQVMDTRPSPVIDTRRAEPTQPASLTAISTADLILEVIERGYIVKRI